MRPVLTELDGAGIVGETELKTEVIDSAWTLVPITTPANWSAPGSGYLQLQYKRVGNVGMIGGAIRCTLAGGPHVNLAVGTLPVGFRPSAICADLHPISISSTLVATLFEVHPDGLVRLVLTGNTVMHAISLIYPLP